MCYQAHLRDRGLGSDCGKPSDARKVALERIQRAERAIQGPVIWYYCRDWSGVTPECRDCEIVESIRQIRPCWEMGLVGE